MAKKRLGKLPPRYRFALSPYTDYRWSKCPKCGRLTYMRKFPLLIQIDGFGLLTLGKTCRYCPKCEFIIAHKDQLESVMAEIFSGPYPDVVGNEYLVIGVVEQKVWKQGLVEQPSIEEVIENTSDFKEHLVLRCDPGGWVPPDREKPGTPRKVYSRPPRR